MWNWLSKLVGRGPGLGSTAQVGTSAKAVAPIKLADVFTPGRPAAKAYVPRPNPERDLMSALSQPGTQIVIYGESGAGKSSLAHRVLDNMGRPRITTPCDSTSTLSSVLTSAFHQTEAWTKTGRSQSDDVTLEVAGSMGVQGIASIDSKAGWNVAQGHEYAPIVSPPLTAEHLARVLGARGLTWIIEDFHKVNESTRNHVADALKVFSDLSVDYPETTIVVLGAAETPGEVWGTAANIQNRLATIAVPPLTDGELGGILDAGAAILNVDFSPVQTEMIRHSVGLASITHALAFETCQTLGVVGPVVYRVVATPDALQQAKDAYGRMRAPQVRDAFEKALAVKQRVRSYDNYPLILKALAGFGEAGAIHGDLLKAIHREEPTYPSGNLTTYLNRLQSDDRGAVVRKTRGGQYRFATPIMHNHARVHFNITTSQDTFWTGVPS